MASWSYSGSYFGTITCSGSISGKDANGNATFSGSMTYTPSSYMATVNVKIEAARISFEMSDGSWIRAQTTFPYGKGTRTRSVSCTIPFGSPYTDSSITGYGVIFDAWYQTYDTGRYTGPSTGGGQTLTSSRYADPTPSMSPISIGVSPSTQVMGGSVSVSEYGGYYAVVSQRQVRYNGSTIANYSSGSWTPALATFEPLCTSANSMTVQLRAYCVASSGAEGSGYSNTVNLTLTVPSDYLPTCSHTYDIINAVNGAIIGGQSGLKITLDPSLTPAGNSATISSCSLQSIVPVPSSDTVPVTTSSFTQSGYEFTCTTLPQKTGVPSYSFKMIFRITDSRGNVLDYETEAFRVTNFVPPLVTITNVNRATATSGSIELTVAGENSTNPSRIVIGDESSPQHTVADVIISGSSSPRTVNVKTNLVQTSVGYTLSYSFDGLTSGNQYNISFVYRDTTMLNYGESSYTYTAILSTLAMPISLYDNGSRMAVSFGEECANDYGEPVVINFAKDSYIRYIKDNVVQLVKSEIAFSGGGCPYNIGDIYITTLTTNPSLIWSGTTWERLEDRFLLGAGTYVAGTTGGEETHTLTIEEMPSHSHNFTATYYENAEVVRSEDDKTVNENNESTRATTNTGGGQAHNNMPPYLVVYMWKRIETPISYSFSVRDYSTYSYDGPASWSEFVASTDNPTLSGEDKVFKLETHATLGNVVKIGRLVSGVATYDRYIYSNQEVIVNSGSSIVNNQAYNAETGDIAFDYVVESNSSEVDILYTTDTHLRWLGNAGSDYTYSPVFSLNDVANYKDSLWNNDIPAFLVDCGDWVHGSTNTEELRNQIISYYNNCGTKGLTKYLAVTFGNHEWYDAVGDASTCNGYLARINNMTACNYLSNGSTVYKGYRAVKVGNKRIGIIGVGYPSPNGRASAGSTGIRSFGGYDFYDSIQTTSSNPNSALYVQVQAIIDKMKASGFDYIIAITHMDKYSDEDFSADTRFNSRANFLIQNTNGLDLVIPGHYNYEIDNEYTFTDLGGNSVKIVREAGASFHSFGRIKLKFDGTAPVNYLLKSRSDLEVI